MSCLFFFVVGNAGFERVDLMLAQENEDKVDYAIRNIKPLFTIGCFRNSDPDAVVVESGKCRFF